MNAIIYNQSDEDYRKAEGFNASGIKKSIRSLAHWKADQDEKAEPTKPLIFGIVFHHLLLTPDAPQRVVIKPDDFDGRSVAGKAWTLANKDKMSITASEHKSCERMVQSIRNHENAAKAFGSGNAEVSVFYEWKNPFKPDEPPLQLKARMDFVNNGTAIVDAKTCEDARPAAFASAAVDFGYFWQSTFYLMAWNGACDALNKPELKKDVFVFVAVEKTPPYAVKCYAVAPGVYHYYQPRIEEELIKFQMAKQANFYPAYPTDVAILNLPEWAVRKEVNNAMKLEATVSTGS